MWALVENSEVILTQLDLPINWNNISSLGGFDLPFIIAQGWYPVIHTPWEESFTTKKGSPIFDILVDKVILTYPPIQKTPEEIQHDVDIYTNSLVEYVQIFMDNKARERNYDGILSLCTYATSTNPRFSTEGQAGVEWRDAVWTKCYDIMAEYQQGLRGIPTNESLLAELPPFTWGE